MRRIKQKWIVVFAALAWFQMAGQAQDQGLGDMMFTAGTVTTDTAGQEWAWLQWMATENALLKDRPMALYRKAGKTPSVNPFFLKGVARQITDPQAIALLLVRGEALGDDLTNLEASVDSLYAGAEPIGSLSLAEKLAALISGSQADPELYQNLVFIGRGHRAVAMAIGQGFACKIPSSGFSTFEIRDYTTSEVIGRVQLEGGNPLVLPAPGPISRVPETSPKGNLNIRLRWDVPDPLKRVSLLQFGYNLYRMEANFAEDSNYDAVPPAASAIAGLVAGNPEVVKVNRAPVLVDPANATPDTWFVVDDNDGLSGGTPFEDGVDYYYFVSALDLLGRDGDLSNGFLTYPCDRFAPSVPHAVRTRAINDYDSATGVRSQWIEVSWAHNTNDTDTARYYVYRHTGIADMQSNAVSAVAHRISGAIVPGPTDSRVYYEDHSLTSNDWSHTFWYSVRAEDEARCGDNLSGNSAPAAGVMRDWEGPPPATGVVVTIQVEAPVTTFDKTTPVVLPTPYNTRLTCKLASPNLPIAWAQFGWHWGPFQGAGSETNIMVSSRFYYPAGVDEVGKNYAIDSASDPNSVVTFFCRVGSAQDNVSEWARVSNEKPGAQDFRYEFKGDISLMPEPIPGGTTGTPPGPHIWGSGPNIVFPTLLIPAVNGAETVRLYRRVDNGSRTLIHQGEMDELLGALITDLTGGTANGGTICYYYQLFDEHGNAGPMVKIICIEVAPRVDLPTPVLNPIDSNGTAVSAPGMTLDWFCTPPGVERFELAIALDETDPVPTFGTPGYSVGSTNEIEVVVGGVTNTLNFGFYRTGRVGTTFGSPGSPQFSLDSLVNLDRDYTIMVRAIGVAGIPGPWSNIETFRWSTVPAVGPQVPWPTREMPGVQTATYHTNLAAAFIDSAYTFALNRVGIRIGEFPAAVPVEKIKTFEVQLFGSFNPADFLYTNAVKTTETMLPCVLYRYQVTNDLYPTVSGDVAQVSPMMENIAYGVSGAITTVYDPFIGITRKSNEDWGVFLMDTQPVVRGAKYQYLLVRFNEETRELDRIIPAGTVTIP